jgi:radical SAM superfamily enzyme YgiQ (UPF0313 family)
MPFDLGRIGRRLARQQPQLVGLSFGSNHAAVAAALARRTREVLPGCWIVAGGVHTTIYPEQVMSWPEVDVAALGEVDDFRFAAVVDELARDRVPERRAGFWFRRGQRIHRNPIGTPVELSASPLPMDLELFDHRSILALKRGWADVHSSRGCPQRCTYCFNEPLRTRYLSACKASRRRVRYVRRRPLDTVLTELHQYRARHGPQIRVFSFTDDQFITSRRWLFEFLERYQSEFQIPLVFLSTATAIDSEVARRSAAAGVYMVRLGVESGSPRVRSQILNRHTPSRATRSAVRALQAAGVNAFAFNMVGIPGESMRELWSTFRFAARLRCDAVKFSLCWPYPGTSLHQRCVQAGLLPPDLGFVGNNTEQSPLRWPRSRQTFLNRIPHFWDVALNRFTANRQAGEFAAVLEALRRLPESEWRGGGAAALRARADALNQQALASGTEAYTAPFGDRRDILLLQSRHRTRPLIM